MATNRQPKPSLTPAAHSGKGEKTIPVTTRFPRATFHSLDKFAKERGLLSVQEVVRVAVSNFLEKSGY